MPTQIEGPPPKFLGSLHEAQRSFIPGHALSRTDHTNRSAPQCPQTPKNKKTKDLLTPDLMSGTSTAQCAGALGLILWQATQRSWTSWFTSVAFVVSADVVGKSLAAAWTNGGHCLW